VGQPGEQFADTSDQVLVAGQVMNPLASRTTGGTSKQMTTSAGPIMSYSQFAIIMAGAEYEGWVQIERDGRSVEEAYREEAYHAPQFRQEYQDLLTAMLLFGPAKFSLPSYFLEGVTVDRLQSEGVVELNEIDQVTPLRTRIARWYEIAFSSYRQLEEDPWFGPVVSLDRLLQGKGQRDLDSILDVEEALGQIEFYTDAITEVIAPLVLGLRVIFGYYFEENFGFYHDTLGDINLPYMRDLPLFHIPSWLIDEDDPGELYRDMGLFLRGPEYREAEFPVFSYYPDDLLSFAEVDERLSTHGPNFTGHMERVLQLGFRLDPTAFIRVHAFWKSFLELVNMLRISEATGNPLFVPSTVDVRPAEYSKQRASSTTDMIRVYRLYLTERGLIPSLECIDDLMRLWDDKRLERLRDVLRTWVDASRSDDIGRTDLIRKDVNRAKRELRNLGRMQRAARLVGYISMPVAVADLAMGSGLGILLAPIGPAVDLYSGLRLRKLSWLNLGT